MQRKTKSSLDKKDQLQVYLLQNSPQKIMLKSVIHLNLFNLIKRKDCKYCTVGLDYDKIKVAASNVAKASAKYINVKVN